MPRRAFLATLITAAVGALMGVVLGAIVGRVIALFGDETVQTSVPMIFCATLGYFVGGASTIKGSLERFGAPRASLATFVATVILVLVVGGVSISAQAGLVVVPTALIALVLASAAGVLIGKPQGRPQHGINSPRTPSAPKVAKEPKPATEPKAPRRSRLARKQKAVEPDPEEEPTRPPAARAARRVSTDRLSEPPPLAAPTNDVDDSLPEDELHDAANESEGAAEPVRPRRDRPLSRRDLSPEPERKPATSPVAKKAPAKKTASAKKVSPSKKAAAAQKAPASNRARAAKRSR